MLATKVEDGPQQRTTRQIILTLDHLYRKRRRSSQASNGDGNHNSNNRSVLSMSKLGPVWKEWYELALEMENRILRELGFTLYWIPDSHPHKFLWEFWRLLLGLEQVSAVQQENDAADTATAGEGDDGDKDNAAENKKPETQQQQQQQQFHYELAQRSWNYCNDSHRLDLCVRFDSEVIVRVSFFPVCSMSRIGFLFLYF